MTSEQTKSKICPQTILVSTEVFAIVFHSKAY